MEAMDQLNALIRRELDNGRDALNPGRSLLRWARLHAAATELKDAMRDHPVYNSDLGDIFDDRQALREKGTGCAKRVLAVNVILDDITAAYEYAMHDSIEQFGVEWRKRRGDGDDRSGPNGPPKPPTPPTPTPSRSKVLG